MNKFLSITLLIILGLTSCVNNSDEPVPPTPGPTERLESEDDLIGGWMTYYSRKEIIIDYNTSQASMLPTFRDISYDGFITSFYKENGKYMFISKNTVEQTIDEGNYKISKGPTKDTILFLWETEDKQNIGQVKDTVVRQVINDINLTTGILKAAFPYTGRNIHDGTRYLITDYKISRNMAIAPNTVSGVLKDKVDFEDMTKGKWLIYGAEAFYNNAKDYNKTQEINDAITGLMFRFFTDPVKGKQVAYSHVNAPKESAANTFSVILIDDLFHILTSEKSEKVKKSAYTISNDKVQEALRYLKNKRKPSLEKTESKSILKSTIGTLAEEELEDLDVYIWVTDSKYKDGSIQTFVDLSEGNIEENVRIVERITYLVKRVE
ncbi:MAG: hypothetical protein E6767_06935 [Dysgonomonas sp.]|nr:hypothetical protein [Dysgonomonas sp.]